MAIVQGSIIKDGYLELVCSVEFSGKAVVQLVSVTSGTPAVQLRGTLDGGSTPVWVIFECEDVVDVSNIISSLAAAGAMRADVSGFAKIRAYNASASASVGVVSLGYVYNE